MPEITFKFNIGGLVIAKVVLESLMKEKELLTSNRFPEGMRIVMRCSEECVAGTQLSYICEPWNGGMQKYAEGSLTPIGEAYDAVLELYAKRQQEKEAAQPLG